MNRLHITYLNKCCWTMNHSSSSINFGNRLASTSSFLLSQAIHAAHCRNVSSLDDALSQLATHSPLSLNSPSSVLSLVTQLRLRPLVVATAPLSLRAIFGFRRLLHACADLLTPTQTLTLLEWLTEPCGKSSCWFLWDETLLDTLVYSLLTEEPFTIDNEEDLRQLVRLAQLIEQRLIVSGNKSDNYLRYSTGFEYRLTWKHLVSIRLQRLLETLTRSYNNRNTSDLSRECCDDMRESSLSTNVSKRIVLNTPVLTAAPSLSLVLLQAWTHLILLTTSVREPMSPTFVCWIQTSLFQTLLTGSCESCHILATYIIQQTITYHKGHQHPCNHHLVLQQQRLLHQLVQQSLQARIDAAIPTSDNAAFIACRRNQTTVGAVTKRTDLVLQRKELCLLLDVLYRLHHAHAMLCDTEALLFLEPVTHREEYQLNQTMGIVTNAVELSRMDLSERIIALISQHCFAQTSSLLPFDVLLRVLEASRDLIRYSPQSSWEMEWLTWYLFHLHAESCRHAYENQHYALNRFIEHRKLVGLLKQRGEEEKSHWYYHCSILTFSSSSTQDMDEGFCIDWLKGKDTV